VGFVAASFVGGIALGLATKPGSVPIYIGAMLIAIALVLLIDSRVQFGKAVLWGLALWLPAHLIGGLWVVDGEVVYAHWILKPVVRYDNLVHAFGFGVAGLATLEAMRRSVAPGSRAVAFLIVWFGGMAIGAVNEIVEWISTKVQTVNNVGDFENSMRDLAANAIGAAVAGWWVARRDQTPV